MLQKAFTTACHENRQPNVNKITKTSIPYLDACIEEVNRVSMVAISVIRQPVVDALILGHMISKGTDVFMVNGGSESVAPRVNMNIPENVRSESSRAAESSSKKGWVMGSNRCT